MNHNQYFPHHEPDPVRDALNLIEVPPNVELAQLCGLFALLDDRGKKTILALAVSQAKLCSKQ